MWPWLYLAGRRLLHPKSREMRLNRLNSRPREELFVRVQARLRRRRDALARHCLCSVHKRALQRERLGGAVRALPGASNRGALKRFPLGWCPRSQHHVYQSWHMQGPCVQD